MTEEHSETWDSPEAPDIPDEGTTVDPEVDARVVEIEQTREEMTTTVEAIGDRLDPANIVSGAKDAVRDATVGKVEDMTSQATDFIGDATASVQDAGGGLIDTIRRNPVPAALVGVGVAWLWKSWSGDSGKSTYRMSDRWRDSDGWRESDRWRGSRGMYGDASWSRSGIGDRAGDMADAVGDRMDAVGDRVDAAGERMGEMGDQFAGTARDYASTAGQVVTDNVLAAGVVAAAVGAAVGLLLPATETERRVMGDAGSKVIDAAQSTASDAMSSMESGTTTSRTSTQS